MAITGEREKKFKTILGTILALGGIAYTTQWGTVAQHLPELLATVLSVFGVGLSATGPSVTKKQ